MSKFLTDIDKVKSLLRTGFQQQLFEAALRNLQEKENQLRYHNFAYSIRELSRHFLDHLSPQENVEQCSWFKVETKDGKTTRAQRIRYAIQGGMSDKLLENLDLDTEELQENIKAILDIITDLNKFTHINEEIFPLADKWIEEQSGNVLETFAMLAENIQTYREQLKTQLDDAIDDHLVDSVISNPFVNIDSLAPGYSLEYSEVTSFHIEQITHDEIVVNVQGLLHVTLEYGSRKERREGDGLDLAESFPFETNIRYVIGDDFPSEDYEVDHFDVDTSSWYATGEEDEFVENPEDNE